MKTLSKIITLILLFGSSYSFGSIGGVIYKSEQLTKSQVDEKPKTFHIQNKIADVMHKLNTIKTLIQKKQSIIVIENEWKKIVPEYNIVEEEANVTSGDIYYRLSLYERSFLNQLYFNLVELYRETKAMLDKYRMES